MSKVEIEERKEISIFVLCKHLYSLIQQHVMVFNRPSMTYIGQLYHHHVTGWSNDENVSLYFLDFFKGQSPQNFLIFLYLHQKLVLGIWIQSQDVRHRFQEIGNIFQLAPISQRFRPMDLFVLDIFSKGSFFQRFFCGGKGFQKKVSLQMMVFIVRGFEFKTGQPLYILYIQRKQQGNVFFVVRISLSGSPNVFV